MSSGNSGSLPPEPQWDRQQSEKTQKHAEYSEGLGSSAVLYPLRNAEGPSKRDERTSDGHDREAIRSQRVIRVNQL